MRFRHWMPGCWPAIQTPMCFYNKTLLNCLSGGCRMTPFISRLKSEPEPKEEFKPGSAPGPRGIFPEDGVQGLDEEIRIRFRKDQRRAQLEDVVMRTIRAGEDAAVAQP